MRLVLFIFHNLLLDIFAFKERIFSLRNCDISVILIPNRGPTPSDIRLQAAFDLTQKYA